ncbi:hypothetical protein [Bacillus sp. AK031]
MKKKKRLVMRTIILLILLSAVTYTLYANIFYKEENKRVQVGDTVPDFTLTNLNGETFTLSSLRGKAESD